MVFFSQLRKAKRADDVALVRLEQLSPFPHAALARRLARYPNAELVWCQEEPKNAGAWSFIEPYLEWVLEKAGSASSRARYVGRPAAAATATGLASKHQAQLRAFLDDALGGGEGSVKAEAA